MTGLKKLDSLFFGCASFRLTPSFVSWIFQIGIDINLAAMHDWLLDTLQFVAGLGPRKAEVIRKMLQMEGRVLTRNDLYSTIRVMEKRVFTNSAGFIRVRGIGQTSSDLPHSEPLDNTRIHPEWYQVCLYGIRLKSSIS